MVFFAGECIFHWNTLWFVFSTVLSLQTLHFNFIHGREINVMFMQKYISNYDGAFSIAVRVLEWYVNNDDKNYSFHYSICVVGFE